MKTILEKQPAVIFETTINTLSDRQIFNRLQKIAAAEKVRDAAEKEIKALRAEIIGGAETVTIDNDLFKVSYNPVVSSRLDSKALKADHPALYAEYSRETSCSRFTYKIK